MKAKILFYLTLLLMPFAAVSAGGDLRLKLGVDGGYDYYIGKHHDPDKVKQIPQKHTMILTMHLILYLEQIINSMVTWIIIMYQTMLIM